MTGFASATEHLDEKDISWEIRSVNHRYLDISLSLPEGFQTLENEFKTLITQHLKRGKIDAILRYQSNQNNMDEAKVSDEILLSKPRVRALRQAHKELESLLGKEIPLNMMDILQWQGVVQQASLTFDKFYPVSQSCLKKALEDLLQSRQREGMQLSGFILKQCDVIEKIISLVRSRRKEVVAALREKVIKRITDLELGPDSVDNNRLEQELVFQAQRLDVDEELDRLDAHLIEVREILKRDDAVGRRLDFLMQELNREANTLASKSNDTETTRAAVDLKVLIEKMREQIMNVE
jgi:uncharacterized protein (TIGR00255 family)